MQFGVEVGGIQLMYRTRIQTDYVTAVCPYLAKYVSTCLLFMEILF